ncbi:RNA-binding protein CP31B, chloroplastic-like, partial [Phalaenopsis equestris]
MSAAPALKIFSLAESSLASLPVHFAFNNSFRCRSKSISRLCLSCSSSSSLSVLPLLLSLRKDKKPSVVPLVARTSGWVGEESSDWNSGEGLEPPDGEFSEGDFMAESDNTVDEGFGADDGEDSYPELLEEAKLFVGNLPYDVDSERLAQLFEGAGIVEVAE